MRHLYLSAAASLLVCSTASAQNQTEARPIPGVVKNAGVYHVATGTWTRNVSSTASLGPDICYSNDVATGYFGTLGSATATGDYSIIDEGRVPGLGGSIATADRTDYEINCISFGYCTDQAGPVVNVSFNFYESYNPCDLIITDPAGSAPFTQSGCAAGTALPGGAGGGVGCWVVTFDLAGGNEFCLEAEGGDQFPGHDGDIDTDAFGIEWIFKGAGGSNTGPILGGDPDWTPSVLGSLEHGGSGTYYDNTGMSTCGNTGLDTQDQVAVDGANSPLAVGCYFFGGYLNTNGCGGPQNNPFASFNTVLFASAGECDATPPVSFCNPAGVNSSNASAVLKATATTGSGVGREWRLDCTGGPRLATSGFGFVVVASSFSEPGLPVNQGVLCLGQPQGRYNPGAGGPRNSLGQFDSNGCFENLSGTATTGNGFGFDIPDALPSPPGGSIVDGQTWHFQLWYRDVNPTPTTNFSNGVSITF